VGLPTFGLENGSISLLPYASFGYNGVGDNATKRLVELAPKTRLKQQRKSSVNLRKTMQAVETTALWLFLLQAFRVLFTALFGVIYDAVFDQSLPMIVVGLDLLLVILAMLTPMLLQRWESCDKAPLGAVLLVFVARILLTVQNPTLQLYSSILLLGAAAFYVARLLWHEPERLALGLVLGLGADQLLRALDYTFDPTLRSGGLPFVVGLTLVLALLSLYLARERPPTSKTRPTLLTGLSLGALLFVQVSLLALPNALSRWSGVGYHWMAPLLLLITLLPLEPALRALQVYLSILFWPLGGGISTLVALLGLVLAALLGGGVAALLLLLVQFLLLFAVTTHVVKGPIKREPELRFPGLEVSLGLVLFLLLNFAFAFTFTYPYTISLFRGLGTLFLLSGVLVAIFPIVNTSVDPEVEKVSAAPSALCLGGIVVVTFVCAMLTRAPSLSAKTPGESLRLATYNIHYGFDTHWNFNLEDMAQAIEAQGVDVVVMQEVDTGRVTSLGVDDALWLGQRLGMHVAYQQTLEKLSGIALLSRYPLEDCDGQWLTSDLEQTAIVYGKIQTSYGPLHVYGLWLGLEPEERLTQVSEALEYMGSQQPAVLGGDFNATPDSPVYARLLDTNLDDPFATAERDTALTSPAIDPTERIDYVWLRGLAAQRAWVPDSTASDHRMVVVEVQLNP
jgi:endonuclease/exonuclease/phosphatase family metal-dependent hydrolase